MTQENKEILDLNAAHQLLVYADDVILLDKSNKGGTLLRMRHSSIG
jgi:hypothetical protein